MAVQKVFELSFLLVTIFSVSGAPFNQTGNDAAARVIRHLSDRVKSLSQELEECKHKGNKLLHLRHFRNKNITCNDGTTAGYYIRRSDQSRNWIIFLEGGWFCFNDQSCIARLNSSMRNLMTSNEWLRKLPGTGILSSDPLENPTWWNASHVMVPYCSSDAWSGNVSRSESGGKFSFMGYRIINEVIKELLSEGLVNSEHLLFTGSSAGAIGVIMNIDRVADMMATAGSSATVLGLSDSGWYMERKISDLPQCKRTPKNCQKPSDAIANGMRYWRGVVPKKCSKEFIGEPWRCYFGHNILRTLKRPLFIFQWRYDHTQLIVENPTTGMKKIMAKKIIINKLFKLAAEVRQSLSTNSISGFFLPACLSHSILTKSDWLSIKVQGYTLDDALNCWISKTTQKHSSSSQNSSSDACKLKLDDDCVYPQCNMLCPLARDPFTGKVIGASGGSSRGFSMNLQRKYVNQENV